MMPDSDSVESVSEQLQSTDVGLRRRTARRVGTQQEGKAFLNDLNECLRQDPAWSVREAAAESIGKIASGQGGNRQADQQRAVLLEFALKDPSEYVREMCRRQLLCLDLAWDLSFVELDATWLSERIHIRRRVLQAYSDFGAQRDPLPFFRDAISDSHWKMRKTTVIELRRHPEMLKQLSSPLVRRCFDLNSSVALRATETMDSFRDRMPQAAISPILDGPSRGPDFVLNVLLDDSSFELKRAFDDVCRQRLKWRNRDMTPLLSTDTKTLVSECVNAASDSRNRERKTHREYAWLVGQLFQLILHDGRINGASEFLQSPD